MTTPLVLANSASLQAIFPSSSAPEPVAPAAGQLGLLGEAPAPAAAPRARRVREPVQVVLAFAETLQAPAGQTTLLGVR